MEMNFCPRCGAPLTAREHPTDGTVGYCERCADYRYPLFQLAVSVVLTDEDETRALLIRQYGERHDVLVAGYVDKGESAEHAVRRELREELGIEAGRVRYLASHYYPPSETLMLNFHATTEQTGAAPNFEVDSWKWVPLERARDGVLPGGLADTLLGDYFA